MVSLNKSFVYGICFASVTWSISLYLYWQISKTEKNVLINMERHNTRGYTNGEKVIAQLKAVPPVVNQSVFDGDTMLSELGLVKNVDDQWIRDNGYKVHAFNVLISNKLSYHRSLPDTRNELCKNITYAPDLPSASVIICFYNEHLHTLLRTIHSVLDRSPPQHLTEVIVVDDCSDIVNLHDKLADHIRDKIPTGRVQLFRTERREGLIRARIFGSRKSAGDVLVFLDSHVEVNTLWLEPLLARIKEDRTNVAVPIIDIINPDTFDYTPSPLVRGGFNWGLHFKWENLPKGTLSSKEDFVKPIKSPTMAGGLFAINRHYFIEMGEYDAGMDIWGGENLEISFRIWMCGGRLDLIPCSRVGHIFRRRRPYGDPSGKDSMLHNSLRVASVWMDDYKEQFLMQRPDARKLDHGNVSERIALRSKLKCNDFNWYLKNVYPELPLATDVEEQRVKKWSALEVDKFQPWHSRKRNYIRQFQIQLAGTSLCIQATKGAKSKGSTLMLKRCVTHDDGKQQWYETDKNEIVLSRLLCLQAGHSTPILYKCHEMGGDQAWKYNHRGKTPIYSMSTGTCLAVDSDKTDTIVKMKLCTNPELSTWQLIS